jgi:hypothetical protein
VRRRRVRRKDSGEEECE